MRTQDMLFIRPVHFVFEQTDGHDHKRHDGHRNTGHREDQNIRIGQHGLPCNILASSAIVGLGWARSAKLGHVEIGHSLVL